MKFLIVPLMIGTTEIVLLAAAALLIFGGKKLPQMMRNMGKGGQRIQGRDTGSA